MRAKSFPFGSDNWAFNLLYDLMHRYIDSCSFFRGLTFFLFYHVITIFHPPHLSSNMEHVLWYITPPKDGNLLISHKASF